jgi:hypothetical protein
MNKKIALLAVGIFAVIGVVATYVTDAAFLANEETVILSNGKQIQLNQDIGTVKRILGSQIFQVNERQYIYRQKANDPIEVVIEVTQRIAVMHLTNLPNNTLASTGVRVGMNLQQLRALYPQVTALPRTVAHALTLGVALEQSRSTQYFLAPPCIRSKPQISLVSLVRKGEEARLARYAGNRVCFDQH